ncbi:MAG: DUF488 family protein [Sinobacteraceae bacterium]|nr:DUF488 family protein [Nevskiaceae bacterium]
MRRPTRPSTAASRSRPRSAHRALRIRIKRIYDPAQRLDGFRVLVDRLWPRGIRKQDSGICAWAKDLAPSTQLRVWFHQNPQRWPEFVRRYRRELAEQSSGLEALRKRARTRPVTLLYAARDPQRNHALVLKSALEKEDSGT